MEHIQKLEGVDGVLAVYAYNLPQWIIPLVIVSKKVDRKNLQSAYGWSNWCIVLTKKDIKEGKDVFALRFLHMKAHANLLFWKDLLKKIHIKNEPARLALESMLRVTLIDMREYMLQNSIKKHVIDRISLSLDRIASYTNVIESKHKTWKNQIHTCIEICAKDDFQYEDLMTIYLLLEKMTKYIDRL